MHMLKQLLRDNWLSVALYGSLFILFGSLLYWQLGSLTPGYSHEEAAAYQRALGLKDLFDNPFNAPFYLSTRLLALAQVDSALATRLVAAGGGLAILGIFFALLRSWQGTRTAVIGTLLFGTSAWFLHTARLGTPEVMFYGVFALFAAGYWLKRTGHWLALAACFGLAALFVYTPGMVWFILAGLLWQWRAVDAAFKQHLVVVSAGALVLIVVIAPLGWTFYQDQSLIMSWLGLPEQWPSPVRIAKDVLLVPVHLILANSATPTRWLGTAPILDIFAVAMGCIGGALYVRHIKLLRTPIMLTIAAISLALIGLGGGSISIILPFIYLAVAGGAGYFIDQWLRVFPRNPIARGVGMSLVGLLVLLAAGYHLRHYFVGWPEAQATHSAYTLRYPPGASCTLAGQNLECHPR